MNWWQQPFVQVALPIMVTFAIATLYQGKRIDDLRDSMNKRFDAVERRLERIENPLRDHDRLITVLEERTSPLHRRFNVAQILAGAKPLRRRGCIPIATGLAM